MSELAINGGTPVIQHAGLHQRYPQIGQRERDMLGQVLDSGVLWGPWAPMVMELERRWAERIGVRYCVATNSGTAALHYALAGCGISPPDEVIVPANSFLATASSIVVAGGIPVFVDVEATTGNIDPTQIESAITPRTKAIIAVHLHGMPANMDALLSIARRHELYLIEDCAQAHGATWNGRPVGSLGDVGIYSLNATKILAGGEGGLLTTDDVELVNRGGRIAVFSTEWRAGERMIRDADSLGYNYRFNELLAAFTLARLESLDHEQAVRQRNATQLIEGISALKGLAIPPQSVAGPHVFQMIRLRLDPGAIGFPLKNTGFRARVLAALAAEGARWWTWEAKPLPAYSLFRTLNAAGGGYPWCLSKWRRTMSYDLADYPVSCATAEDAIFTTAHYPPNNHSLIELYIEAFHKVWGRLEEVCALPEQPLDNGIFEIW